MATIRAPRTSDAQDLAPLLGQLGYPAAESDLPARLASFVDRDDAVAWVAESEGRVIGVATAHVIRSLHKSELVALLTMLVVDQQARGQGVGRLLVRHAETWAAAQGASAISLTSALRRADAHEFYRRLGYEQTGVRLGKSLRPG